VDERSVLIERITNILEAECDMLDISARRVAEEIIRLCHTSMKGTLPTDSSSIHSQPDSGHGSDS